MLLRSASTFRRLWVGQFVSTIGDGMQRIALLWWAKHHGGNGLLAAVALSTVVPTVVCSPVGGWLADHVDRRLLLVGADLSRLALSGLLAALLFGGDPPVAVVCALVVLAAVAASVFDPAYNAAVPTIVADEHLPAANGLNMANGAVGGLVGPLAGGVLIAVTDIGWVMVVNAATFAWSAACIAACRLPLPVASLAATGERAGIRASLSAVRAIPDLGRLVALAATLNMVVAPVPMMIAALAIDRLDAGPATFGVLEMLLSAGLLVGSIAAGVLARGRLALPFHVLGVSLAVVGVVPASGAAVALVVGGVAIAVANTEALTRFQRSVPAEVQGRVFGVLGSMSEGLRPAGLALGAPLLAIAGVSGAFAAVGAGIVLATIAFTRHLDVIEVPATRVSAAHPGVPETLG
ncbi:MAG: MFS transporter [Acidimicrobiales bacterium]|nr:MFS transporter [Acidimicrobiales bacterium]MCB9395251.1 MFS transporter [Acidimicrobiaceae bacterium]